MEFKTYICDICGIQQALHIKFSAVDEQLDPVDSKYHPIPGYIDLCPKHLVEKLNKYLDGLAMSEQRQIWKSWLPK